MQRGGPSTGLPTKTEQSDLLQAMFGRNGEAPVPIVAPRSPGDCFDAAVEAVRIATQYMTPVILLTDGYIANGSEPWLIPDYDKLPEIPVNQYKTPLADERNRIHGDALAPDVVPVGLGDGGLEVVAHRQARQRGQGDAARFQHLPAQAQHTAGQVDERQPGRHQPPGPPAHRTGQAGQPGGLGEALLALEGLRVAGLHRLSRPRWAARWPARRPAPEPARHARPAGCTRR